VVRDPLGLDLPADSSWLAVLTSSLGVIQEFGTLASSPASAPSEAPILLLPIGDLQGALAHLQAERTASPDDPDEDSDLLAGDVQVNVADLALAEPRQDDALAEPDADLGTAFAHISSPLGNVLGSTDAARDIEPGNARSSTRAPENDRPGSDPGAQDTAPAMAPDSEASVAAAFTLASAWAVHEPLPGQTQGPAWERTQTGSRAATSTVSSARRQPIRRRSRAGRMLVRWTSLASLLLLSLLR